VQGPRVILIAAALWCGAWTPVLALEGPSAAGPIGGSDIRSALLPPPGLYGGVAIVGAGSLAFVDGKGDTIPELREAYLAEEVGGPFLYYVPDLKMFGGSVGIGGFLPFGNLCGHLDFGATNQCKAGVGDPYLEMDWSRFFGTWRPSQFAGAYPIPEGLALLAGFGIVFPTGFFDNSSALNHTLSLGTNVWDFAPSVAITYTTPPLLVEGTEISAKFYWNNYQENPTTHYWTGDFLDLDFAVTEHIGRFQVGFTGFYVFQIKDDEEYGYAAAPDGRKAEILRVGGLINYDMPEYDASVRIKTHYPLIVENCVQAWAVMFAFFKKF
jgi:hypothetical protein